MKNKTNIIFILLTILVSIIIAISVELLFFNRNVLMKNNEYSLTVVDSNNMKKVGPWYISTSDEAYITLRLKSSYMNKVRFDYSSNNDFNWSIVYNSKNQGPQNVEYKSSSFIHKAIRKLGDSADEIKIIIYSKDVKIRNFKINNKIYWNWSRIIFIISFITVFAVFVKYRNYFCIHLEKAFLLISIVTGILLILVSPKTVYTAWDDQIHIKNSYTMFSKKDTKFSKAFQTIITLEKMNPSLYLTQEEQLELYHELNVVHNKTRNRVIQINNYAPKYNKIVYLPFYLGFKISDLCHFSFIIGFLLAKLLNLFLYIILIYFAIKVSTVTKKIIFIIGLLVSNLFLATQFSYDSSITASLLLALALFIRTLELKKINYKYIIAFVLSVIWASLPKAIYCPILLLLLFIPNVKFKTRKQAMALKISVIAITLLLMSTFVLPVLLGTASGDIRGGNTSVSGQLNFIFHNPVQYGKILLRSFIADSPELFLGFKVFTYTCYLYPYTEIVTPMIYIINLILILYVTFTNPINKEIVDNKIKTLFSIMILGIWLLITTALYLSFTEVGSNTIAGVQPRYFISMLLPLLLVLSPTLKKKENSKSKSHILVLLIPYLILMIIIFLLIYKGRGI